MHSQGRFVKKKEFELVFLTKHRLTVQHNDLDTLHVLVREPADVCPGILHGDSLDLQPAMQDIGLAPPVLGDQSVAAFLDSDAIFEPVHPLGCVVDSYSRAVEVYGSAFLHVVSPS